MNDQRLTVVYTVPGGRWLGLAGKGEPEDYRAANRVHGYSLVNVTGAEGQKVFWMQRIN